MSMQLLSPNKEIKERVWKEFGLNEQSIKEAVETIKNWLLLQPHLPKEYDEGRLERWLIRCKNSIERTKHSLDTYYKAKTMIPELMSNWDTNSEWMKTISSLVYLFPIPKLTPDCNRVVVTGFLTPDATKFVGDDYLRLSLMSLEIRMCEDYCFSDIYVFDMENYSLGHVPKITLPSLKKAEICSMKGYNTRLKALHVINAPSYGKYLIDLVKLVLKAKLASRIFVHGSDFKTLHEHVPRDCLPLEMGGTCGTINEDWGRWQKKLQSYQAWFRYHQNLKSDEKKRPDDVSKSDDIFGFEGTFRQLNLD